MKQSKVSIALAIGVHAFSGSQALASYVFNCEVTGEVMDFAGFDPDSGVTYADILVQSSEVAGRADGECAAFLGQVMTLSFTDAVRDLEVGETVTVERSENDLADEVTRVYFFLRD